jgi:hypothetical protein
MVSQIERGIRGLPMGAVLPQAALTLARHQTLAEPDAEPLDTRQLRRHQQTCQLRADNLALELRQLTERATWARRRLAALPILHQALTPANGMPPAWLERFGGEARNELVRSGSTAQALLRLRQAALLAEAAATGELLAAAGQQ